MITGAPVIFFSFAAPPIWSMCACVITIIFTVNWCLARIASISLMSSPGSTTIASRVTSSPKIEQLHCNCPTGNISWIISSILGPLPPAPNLRDSKRKK